MLSQRREVLDDVETITAYALDMSNFLHESELTERRAFIESFVKEIVVMPDNAVVRFTIPMPEDSPIGGEDAEEMALNGSVLSTVKFGGRWRARTSDLLRVKQALLPSELIAPGIGNEGWHAWRGSNPQPPAPQAGALSN